MNYDLKDIYGVSSYATGTGSVCPELLPATSTPRTILKAWIITDPGDAVTDNYIRVGNYDYLQSNSAVNSFVEYPIVSASAVTCTRQKDKAVFYSVVYIPYDVRTATDTPIVIENATGTPLFVSDVNSQFFTIEHPTSTFGNFNIKREYTFGDITIILLGGFLAFFCIFYFFKKIFTHDEVKIHTIHHREF